jgi:hypothetical protein
MKTNRGFRNNNSRGEGGRGKTLKYYKLFIYLLVC